MMKNILKNISVCSTLGIWVLGACVVNLTIFITPMWLIWLGMSALLGAA